MQKAKSNLGIGCSNRRLLLLFAVSTIWMPIFWQRSPAQSGMQPEVSATKSLSFEVVSIRRNLSGKGIALDYTPDGFMATGVPIQWVIVNAYKIRDPDLMIGGKLLPGAPSWVNSDRYDVRAKISPSDLLALQSLTPEQQIDQKRLMLQSMLEDRFKLKVRAEAKPIHCYALSIDKNGPKLKKAASSDPTLPDGKMLARPGYVRAQGVPLSKLVFVLTAPLNCPPQDRTGLTGKYDFTLQYSVEQGSGPMYMRPPDAGQYDVGTSSADSSTPSLFTAIREQLGLKLIPATVPIQGVFIEHIERPSEN